jgi:calcineurin-binding protein cabin-1
MNIWGGMWPLSLLCLGFFYFVHWILTLFSRCWCTHSDGFLLHFMVEQLNKELNKAEFIEDGHPFKEDLDSMIEQCFFCLYGHPNKKAKTKHLQDHNAEPV